MKEIKITDIEGIRVGNAQDTEAGTGCTVIICEKGGCAGVDVRGGGPASHETELLNPINTVDRVHGIVLSGGSAFGLEATSGVMQYLEERGIGFDVGIGVVPIVCGASLFDLTVGSSKVRPDKAMGYQACCNSEKNCIQEGNCGAGTGATVGKYRGMDRAMKSGLGIYCVELENLKVGAIVGVNAIGNVIDSETNKFLAGLLNEEKVDIGNVKVDIQSAKVDIGNVLFTKNNGFSAKTIAHIHRLFVEFGFDEAFGRSAVMELLALKGSGASKLLSNLVQADIIRPVPGYGKGKYKFKKVI